MEEIAVLCLQELRRMGVRTEVIRDFETVSELMEGLGRPLSGANDPQKLLMTRANSFWVAGYSNDKETGKDKIVIGGGVRVDDLREESAQAFVGRSIGVLFGTKATAVEDASFEHQYWGRAAYVGSLTSNLATGLGRQSRFAVQLIMAYTHYRAFIEFGSEVNYCFLRQGDHSKAVTYGFMNAGCFPWRTEKPMYQDGNPGWLMTTRRDQLPSLMLSASRIIDQRLGVDDQLFPRIKVNNSAGGK
ncbi:MAG: hypothetical protein AAFQ58_19115 [Pseudomonadota bacterium]